MGKCSMCKKNETYSIFSEGGLCGNCFLSLPNGEKISCLLKEIATSESKLENLKNMYYEEEKRREKGEVASAAILEFSREEFVSAVEMALEAGQVSTSHLQRRLRLSYTKAGKIVDEMERLHIVSGPNGSKPRSVLIDISQWVKIRRENETG